jgi:hypothetical protein
MFEETAEESMASPSAKQDGPRGEWRAFPLFSGGSGMVVDRLAARIV